MTIIRDDVLGGEPRTDGTRVGVRHVAALVIEGGQSPTYTADEFDLSLAEVYESLVLLRPHRRDAGNRTGERGRIRPGT